MPGRDLTIDAAVALQGSVVTPVFLVTLSFSDEIVYCHSSVGTIVYNGNSFLGVGSFGGLSVVSEQSDMTATGVTLQLSGIPPSYLNDAMNFANGSGFGQVLMGFILADGSLVGDPFPLYGGQLDDCVIDMSVESVTITVSIENKLSDMNRSRGSRYTNACQVALYPADTAFAYVQYVGDLFVNWKAKS